MKITSQNMEETARDVLHQSSDLGFDHLSIKVFNTKLLGVRVARGAVCRENVYRDHQYFQVFGHYDQRESTFTCASHEAPLLYDKVKELRRNLEAQTPDKEAVVPQPPMGTFQWILKKQSFESIYAPAAIYESIERHVAKARKKGLRVTGYLEAQEKDSHKLTDGGFALKSRDQGLIISFTVDDPETGATGSAERSCMPHAPEEIDGYIQESLEDALETCKKNHSPVEIEPGDYTVILSPKSLLDIVSSAISCGLFDRRKIDEGRTYLSHRLDELRFPDGLHLSQTLNLPLIDQKGKITPYCDVPFNHRGSPCDSLNLIDGGRVKDLHTEPYWSKRHGFKETFAPTSAPPLHLSASPDSSLSGACANLDALIKDTERGIYVANTWYLRMVSEMEGVITGMTRDGLFEIENGRIKRPLLNMRWHDNPVRILSAINGMTDQKILLGRSRLSGSSRQPFAYMPAVRTEGFHFSSVTRF